ncbi:esterase-like activity of phytase family protein [Roseivivax isoporae]|uniref:Phytase-like domain-containing protein n=1 Tax=Roseivivax isoporae LMG 25204 TaxID=1449351 RepID=X7F4E0_9RHOB|nr:esterase-like activity of phytase family protein [Roseivivax isoporae]ETX27670.1 hypothetical protein RISW2_12045 [Roseivivax isoporae LMG 25204]
MLRRPGLALGAGLAAILALSSPAGHPGQAAFVGSFRWTSDHPAFGGFSGLEVSPDGASFVAIGDRGRVVQGTFRREEGRIVSVARGDILPLRGPQGAPLDAKSHDAEGLARTPRGQLYVSFEGRHRVAALDPSGRTHPLDRPRSFARLQANSGLEALAADANGLLYAIPERSGAQNRPFPVWRFAGGAWRQAGELPRSGGFLVVGADFGPDGRFYLLERAFTGIGFRTRVRRFDHDRTGFRNGTTLLETATRRHDNLEGLSVWRDAGGTIRLTMLSDDNMQFFQQTEFVEYRVPD